MANWTSIYGNVYTVLVFRRERSQAINERSPSTNRLRQMFMDVFSGHVTS
jgi:hypothetical protein